MRVPNRRTIFRYVAGYVTIVVSTVLVSAYLAGNFRGTAGSLVVIVAVASVLFAGGVVMAVLAIREMVRNR